jgi:hypothetical protein
MPFKFAFTAFSLAYGLLTSATLAHATTLLIVTDQTKAVKAQEVAALFRTTPPFSRMPDLTLKVIQTSPTKLGCQIAPLTVTAQELNLSQQSVRSENLLEQSEWHSPARKNLMAESLPTSCDQKSAPIARLISCDTPRSTRYLAALAKTEKAKYIVVAVTESRYGGSGGTYPVITTGSPASMAIHELMHQLGFADEYSYTNACEADMYCATKTYDSTSPSGYGLLPGTSFNVAAFNALSNYGSNADVRKAHSKVIPWLSLIAASTDLTNAGKLGSVSKADEIGLFRSIVCDKATKHLETWQSTTDVTIMQSLSTTYIPNDYWPTIAKSLGTTIKK